MHASGLFCPHQTTGSMVAHLRKNADLTVWLAASSAPCLSLFKPIYFGNSVLNEEEFKCPGAQTDDSYWWQFENFHRQALSSYPTIIEKVRADQNRLESAWLEKDNELTGSAPQAKGKFSRNCLDESLLTLQAWQSSLEGQSRNGLVRNFLYKRFWAKQNAQVNFTPSKKAYV
jgi:dipeptidase